jgi:dienelactone hydrolase
MRPVPLLALPLLFAVSCTPSTLSPPDARPAVAAASPARADFLKMIDRPRVPLDPTVEPAPSTAAGLAAFKFSYATQAGDRVPGILVKPAAATGRLPVVISLHGTGGNKESQAPFLRQLAGRGFLAVAIDGPYHGTRAKGSASGHPNDYEQALIAAYHGPGPDGRQARPFFIDTVWDVMRLIDYLDTRDDVDPARIGLFGISKGGIETYLTAAVDPRVAAAVPCISVESFRWAVDNDKWQPRIGTIQAAFDAAAKADGVAAPDAAFVKKFYSRVATGIDGAFDGPAMVPLIAPRPLFVINGELDPRTPPAGLKECTDAARAAYRAQHAENNFKLLIQPNTPHRVNPESQQMALEWLVECLKPTPIATRAARP